MFGICKTYKNTSQESKFPNSAFIVKSKIKVSPTFDGGYCKPRELGESISKSQGAGLKFG